VAVTVRAGLCSRLPGQHSGIPTSEPAPDELLLYPGAVGETELLLPDGSCAFASKAGQFAGTHFATVVEGADKLREVGLRCLWQGAQAVRITES